MAGFRIGPAQGEKITDKLRESAKYLNPDYIQSKLESRFGGAYTPKASFNEDLEVFQGEVKAHFESIEEILGQIAEEAKANPVREKVLSNKLSCCRVEVGQETKDLVFLESVPNSHDFSTTIRLNEGSGDVMTRPISFGMAIPQYSIALFPTRRKPRNYRQWERIVVKMRDPSHKKGWGLFWEDNCSFLLEAYKVVCKFLKRKPYGKTITEFEKKHAFYAGPAAIRELVGTLEENQLIG